MAAVEAADRDAWLALFAPDAVIEDPIGVSVLDPTGEGHRGSDAIAAFWDTTIASGVIRFDIRESYAAGNEVANVGTITTTFPDGTGVAVDGVFTYRVGDDSLIRALRAFWSEDSMRASESGPG
jgi:ketosteroid isomerase-like protein